MSKKYLVSIDLNRNEINNARIQNLATAPGSPLAGLYYYDTVTNAAYVWNGTAWRPTDAAKLTDGSIPITALATNPLARANHTGTQLSSTISDLATTVKAYKLNEFAAPTADVTMGGFKITNVATPTVATDAANKQYVDDSIAGLSWKDEVRVATVAAGTLASSFANGSTVDGVALSTGDRILIKDQATQTENGIYTVNASGAPTRATDADSGAELKGTAVFVSNGTTNGGTRWVCNTTGTITVGTTAITFVAFGGGTTYTAGNGLSLGGNTFTVTPAASGGLSVSAAGVALDTTIAARKYAVTIGDGALTAIAVTHNLGNQDVVTQVRQVSDNAVVECDIVNTSSNVVTLTFAVAPAASALRVSVVG